MVGTGNDEVGDAEGGRSGVREMNAGAGRALATFDDGRVGVYVHLPFCTRICPYCDFAVVSAKAFDRELEARYKASLRRELEARLPDFSDRPLATLYFGGGTPSLFHPETIAELVEAVETAFPPADGPGDPVEITLELNPSTLEIDRLPAFRDAGIGRLSIGIQSFDDGQLKRLGRAHRAAVARKTLEAAREAGFDNLSIDLIFAGPGQTRSDLDRDLDELLRWRPEHVSTYELTLEPGTPFGRAHASGRMKAFDEDVAADMIGQIEDRLGSEGFERYEISNHARPGFRSSHNGRYWRRQAVLGLGMGAHSMEARGRCRPHGARRANPRTLSDWFERIELDPAHVGEIEMLPVTTARGEAIFLALRQRDGLVAREFEAEFGAPPRAFFESEIERTLAQGWLEEGIPAPGDLRLTPIGRLLADSVAAEFVSGQ